MARAQVEEGGTGGCVYTESATADSRKSILSFGRGAKKILAVKTGLVTKRIQVVLVRNK
jgi:hypothetical protein